MNSKPDSYRARLRGARRYIRGSIRPPSLAVSLGNMIRGNALTVTKDSCVENEADWSACRLTRLPGSSPPKANVSLEPGCRSPGKAGPG